ncbi:hypothetical protein [Actinokineospora enzanensis]|uniref:hypothetical protein n=1 Tax=Actinokineospora enzanensis TaxID=155975 RepID=UPI0012EB8824|nr:hypothetical protein [Actinokineospora enzanensis]
MDRWIIPTGGSACGASGATRAGGSDDGEPGCRDDGTGISGVVRRCVLAAIRTGVSAA